MHNVKIFSFFSGCGFLDLGFENAGYDVAFVNEYSKPFLDAYIYSRSKLNHPAPEYGYHNNSIEDFLTDTQFLKGCVQQQKRIGNLVGFIGGPPCPDFSVGGKNKGAEGDNGKLSRVYADLIIQQKPDFFLFENVKGLWRTKKHRAFYDSLKTSFEEAGYILDDRLMNSIEYGAPQDRERIILIGFHQSLLASLSLKELKFPWLEYAKYPKDEVFEYKWPATHVFAENSLLTSPKDIPAELTVQYWFKKNDVENHPNASHHFTPKAGLNRFLVVEEGDDSRKSFKRLHRWRYSPTACYGNNEVHLHPYKARRISVAEALAIQSLPKEFVLPPDMTLSNMFKTIGNGVPYLAAYNLARALGDVLNRKAKNSEKEKRKKLCAA